MAANPQQQFTQSLSVDELLGAALVFIDKARKELGTAPKRIRDELDGVRENVDTFRESLEDELYEAIWDEGRECQDCVYCERDSGYTAGKGLTDQPTRECNARTPMTCPAVAELLGGGA